MKKEFIVSEDYSGKRVDVFIPSVIDITRSYVKKLCDDGLVFCCGKQIKANKILKLGELIEVEIPEPEELSVKPENIPLDIVYQDSDIAVINKQQGLTVHAGNGTESTLVNALLYHLDSLSGINGVVRPGIVHRIDKNTSGLLVVAKNDKAHLSLSKQIEEKTCKRIYIALLEGVVKQDEGQIETFISRSEKDRTKMAVSSQGRKAVTDYKVLKRYQGYTLMRFSLQTGRTHQIRVHAKYIGHPVVGDPEYGFKNQRFSLNGQLLHAFELTLCHPSTSQVMTFNAPLPDYFESIMQKLKPLE